MEYLPRAFGELSKNVGSGNVVQADEPHSITFSDSEGRRCWLPGVSDTNSDRFFRKDFQGYRGIRHCLFIKENVRAGKFGIITRPATKQLVPSRSECREFFNEVISVSGQSVGKDQSGAVGKIITF